MATDNQLQARIPPTHAEHISQIAKERGEIPETEVERDVIQEGLAAMGYVDRPIQGSELWLWYVRQAGLTFGLVGLIMVGYGIFGPRSFSVVGFALLLTGFLGVVLEEILPRLPVGSGAG